MLTDQNVDADKRIIVNMENSTNNKNLASNKISSGPNINIHITIKYYLIRWAVFIYNVQCKLRPPKV